MAHQRDGGRREKKAADALIYGINPVVEILTVRPDDVERVWISDSLRGPSHQKLLDHAKKAQVRVEAIPRDRIDQMAPGAVHQGVVARVAEISYLDLPDLLERVGEEEPLFLALDQIQDPIHLGASIRSAHLMGSHGVIIPQDRAVGLTPAAMKSSAGAAAYLPIARVVNLARSLEELKEAGVWIVGADMSGEPCDQVDLRGPTCLVIGGEGKGLRHLTRERCDRLVSIPMEGQGVGSLSASASASILLYEIARQRRLAKKGE